MAFLVHEHCHDTSAIDKYWLFSDAASARKFFNEKTEGFKDFLDLVFYQELDECKHLRDCDELLSWLLENETGEHDYVQLTEDDYLVLTKIDSEGFGRRP